MCGGPLKCGGPCSAEHVRTLVNPALPVCARSERVRVYVARCRHRNDPVISRPARSASGVADGRRPGSTARRGAPARQHARNLPHRHSQLRRRSRDRRRRRQHQAHHPRLQRFRYGIDQSINQSISQSVSYRDLRIGNFWSNRISNRISGYDSNSNRISNRIRG